MATAATGKILVRAGRPRPSVARTLSTLTLRIAPATPERGPSYGWNPRAAIWASPRMFIAPRPPHSPLHRPHAPHGVRTVRRATVAVRSGVGSDPARRRPIVQ